MIARVVALVASLSLLSMTQAPRLRPDPPITCESCPGWNGAQAPFRVYGNTYYVAMSGTMLSAVPPCR